MARLDRLGPAPKEIAQIAAAIGREFSYELLAPVAQRGETELREGLGRLADAGLIFIRGAPPHATYLFKHALVRDAAYGSLLRRRREELHARIAAVLETDFADRVAAEPELLARHLTDAGLLEKAVPWWLQAGEKAAERWANREAIAHLTRGLGVLKLLPETRQRDEQELRFQIALASAYGASQGFGASGHGEAALRAAGLCERLGGHLPKHIRALFGTATFHMGHGEVRAGLTAGEECLVLAERLQDPVFLGQAHNLIGLCLFFLGDVRRSRSHLEQALALYEAAHDRVDLWGVGDAGVNCHSFLCRILWHLGYPDRALKHSERAIALAEEAARPFSTAEALSWAAALHQLRGDVGRCRALAEADLAFTTEHVLPFFAGHVMALGGWAQVKQGLIGEGEARLREGVATYRTAGGEIELPHWLGLMAEACGTAGRVDEALAVLHEALAIVERNGSRYYEAELSRLEGELLLASEEPDETGAEASFRKAIATARGQGAKSFELRAATSLARLMGRQGRLEEAHALLAPVYAWFTEGFDTADLKAAKALLDSLQ
jgi:predicted ATPase